MPEILYRKYRPTSFEELAGQEHVTTTLANALSGGRIAHAYLFSGPRGTGKTTTGRLLAKALNCKNRPEGGAGRGDACNQCESCLSYLSSRAMDLIEMDAASNRGIEEIRSLRDKVGFAPGAGEFKVYLIDEVHMLTDQAFNALLKTLEEPPPHVIFILATTDAHKVPATILSRCQRLDFRRAPLASSIGNLQRICAGEGINCESDALELIARSATGSHRDAVNLLDQLVTSYGNELSVEHVRSGLGLIGDERSARLAYYAIGNDLAGGLELIGSVRDDGLDLRQFQRELVAELRSLLLVKSGLTASQVGVTEERRKDLDTSIRDIPIARILGALRSFGEADLKQDPDSTLPLDIALAECLLGLTTVAAVGAPEPAAAGRPAAAPAPAARQAPPQRDFGAPPQRPQTPAPTPSRSLGSVGDIRAPEPPPDFVAPGVVEEPAPERPAATRAPDLAAAGLPSLETFAEDPGPLPPPNASEGASGSVEPTLTSLRQNMRVIAVKVRDRSVPLGALLNSGCDIIKVSDREVVFGFKFAIHADRVKQKANLDHLKAVILELTGQDMSINCLQAEDVTDWRARDPASRSSLVRAAQEMGARVLSPGPEGPA